jgi:hypothetical protein
MSPLLFILFRLSRRLLPITSALALATTQLLSMDHSGARPFDPRVFATSESPDGLAPGSFVPNFRLTDHTGTTRELYYESTTKAVVLVFTASGSPRRLQTASALRALRARWAATDVTLWQIDSNLAADRAALVAEQALFNNPTPVLLDEAQLVGQDECLPVLSQRLLPILADGVHGHGEEAKLHMMCVLG